MKRIFCALVTLTTLSALLFVAVPSASATTPTPVIAADTATGDILGVYQNSTGLFSTSCPVGQESGNCWWWTADTFMALFDYAENDADPGQTQTKTNITAIKDDFANTFSTVCGGGCPGDANDEGMSPFDNHWYDDMGWWEQALINAYELTTTTKYLYAAEQLWNNITAEGYKQDCGLIVQQNADPTKPELEDGFANSLYVRDSAWLYEITGNAQYMSGQTDGKGGAIGVADNVVSEMTNQVAGTPAPGTPGSEFFIAGETDPSSGCTAATGTQKWLSTQGEMVNGFADLSVAFATYCPVMTTCDAQGSYFSNLADELAATVTTNSSLTSPPTIFGSPAILSEPCKSQDNTWPDDCTISGTDTTDTDTTDTGGTCTSGTCTNAFSSFLIFKGNFERGAYCSLHDVNDSALRLFIENNAEAIAALPHFGFLWEPGSDTNVTFGTRASILDGLEAYIGGSTLMCAGGS
jgi:hypothetical protein